MNNLLQTTMSNATLKDGDKISGNAPSSSVYRGNTINSGLKIVEQKRPYYYEDPGEASSR